MLFPNRFLRVLFTSFLCLETSWWDKIIHCSTHYCKDSHSFFIMLFGARFSCIPNAAGSGSLFPDTCAVCEWNYTFCMLHGLIHDDTRFHWRTSSDPGNFLKNSRRTKENHFNFRNLLEDHYGGALQHSPSWIAPLSFIAWFNTWMS